LQSTKPNVITVVEEENNALIVNQIQFTQYFG